MIDAIRRCDACSDDLLKALIAMGPKDLVAPVTVLAALLRLRASRCRGMRERVDALAGELAFVLGEAWRGELPAPHGRRLANVMADRAWGRVRAAERKGHWLTHVPAESPVFDRLRPSEPPDEAVVATVAIAQFDASLHRAPGGQRAGAVVRAWDSAVELAGRQDRTPAERYRWNYVRRVLNRHVTVDLELIDPV